jgi:hypothetical protein
LRDESQIHQSVVIHVKRLKTLNHFMMMNLPLSFQSKTKGIVPTYRLYLVSSATDDDTYEKTFPTLKIALSHRTRSTVKEREVKTKGLKNETQNVEQKILPWIFLGTLSKKNQRRDVALLCCY